MKIIMPQEIEVWYLIPALRREITKVLVKDHNLSQKKTADILGITEPAVSQYLSFKRGKEIKFSEKEKIEIEKVAEEISKNPGKATNHLYNLCVKFRGSDVMCRIHKKHDLSISSGCRLCAERELKP